MLPPRFLWFRDSSDTSAALRLLSTATLPSPCLFLKLELNCHKAPSVQKSHEEYQLRGEGEGTILQGKFMFRIVELYTCV